MYHNHVFSYDLEHSSKHNQCQYYLKIQSKKTNKPKKTMGFLVGLNLGLNHLV